VYPRRSYLRTLQALPSLSETCAMRLSLQDLRLLHVPHVTGKRVAVRPPRTVPRHVLCSATTLLFGSFLFSKFQRPPTMAVGRTNG
jgi:hypothetical protein